jgi:hypothetical protein
MENIRRKKSTDMLTYRVEVDIRTITSNALVVVSSPIVTNFLSAKSIVNVVLSISSCGVGTQNLLFICLYTAALGRTYIRSVFLPIRSDLKLSVHRYPMTSDVNAYTGPDVIRLTIYCLPFYCSL